MKHVPNSKLAGEHSLDLKQIASPKFNKEARFLKRNWEVRNKLLLK